jgi:hypothetical protein
LHLPWLLLRLALDDECWKFFEQLMPRVVLDALQHIRPVDVEHEVLAVAVARVAHHDADIVIGVIEGALQQSGVRPNRMRVVTLHVWLLGLGIERSYSEAATKRSLSDAHEVTVGGVVDKQQRIDVRDEASCGMGHAASCRG